MKKILFILSSMTFALLAGCATTPATTTESSSSSSTASTSTPSTTTDTSAASTSAAPTSATVVTPPEGSVYYDFDKSDVKDQYKTIVGAHAAFLKANPKAKVEVQGNADERGSREYNLALGERRANAAKKVLELDGVKAAQIKTVSFGKEKPKVTGHDESAWSQNRRSDFVYTLSK